MELSPECVAALRFPEKQQSFVAKFLYFRLASGNLENERAEYHQYNKELDILMEFFAARSEQGRMLSNMKTTFKENNLSHRVSSPSTMAACVPALLSACQHGNHRVFVGVHTNWCKHKRAKTTQDFWKANSERLDLVGKLMVVEQKSKLQDAQGLLNFKQIGQQRLDDAAVAVHQQQYSSYMPRRHVRRPSVDSLDSEAEQSKIIPSYRDKTEMDEADVALPREVDVNTFVDVQPMTDRDWADAVDKINRYREGLAKEQRLHNPLYYFLVDHSGHHGPTTDLLAEYLPAMKLSLSEGSNFDLPPLSDEQETIFNRLLASKHPGDVSVKTDEDRLRNPLQCLKETISEMEHTSRNVMPLLDATVGLDQECRIHYGEQTLDTTADRRGEGSDPTQRARIGYKVDIIIEYQELSWLLAIGCGEVAGGLPQCSRAKEWTDTLKLGLELRDIWYKAQNELEVSTAADLIIWGFTATMTKSHDIGEE
ncbi:hypothetical protein BC938DRAFT_478439 [Jimgerdemannia flammicorona]|uniref:Uncharacterized protein n=1 Tax=Jimgerdemannia flammicorona TaxID=994334 RepID=A0A433QYH1_9FUNG|nr:hypothetical protein BC938DRAFT_478439 [Jimgerdemannia flammicorona]